jgi:hypothetical protein
LLIKRDSLICFNEFFTILNHRLLVIEKSLHRLLVKEIMGLIFYQSDRNASIRF